MNNVNDDFILGYDIGGTYLRAALARGDHIVAQLCWPWVGEGNASTDIEAIGAAGHELMKRASASMVCGAGIALAVRMNTAGQVVSWPNRNSWEGLAFVDLLRDRLLMPIVVEDDANAAALGEWRFGAARGYRNVVVVTVGTGIGAGLIVNGELLRGTYGHAGELGHTYSAVEIADDGTPRGCLQDHASGRALETSAREQGFSDIDHLAQAAFSGHTWACEILESFGRRLGYGISNVVNLIDPEVVVISGGLARLGDPWWTAMVETVQRCKIDATTPLPIVPTTLDGNAGILGAIALILQTLSNSKIGTK